jgi:cytoskeletal protein CcmA (bactofilin family)/uncharacterized membrane protein (DUF485 family)
VPQEKVIAYNYWKVGGLIDIAGTLEKDAYVVGQTLNVDGVIHGDLVGLAETLNLNGTVDGNVRFAAQTVYLNGKVGKNVMIAANNIYVGSKAEINWELLTAGSLVRLDGTVGSNANVSAVTLDISGTVNGRLDARVDKLNLGPSAKIGGDIKYISANDLSRAEAAVIGGTIVREEPPQPKQSARGSASVFWGFSALLVALVIFWLFKKPLTLVAKTIRDNFPRSLGLGLAILFVWPISSLMIMLTGIGFPLGFISLVIYCVFLYLAKFFALFSATEYLMGKVKFASGWPLVANYLIVIIIGFVLCQLPVVGGFFALVLIASGLGGVFGTLIKK